MKFDTNKTKASTCTKLSSGQVYLMDNRSIPTSAPGWEFVPNPNTNASYDADHEDDDDMNVEAGGRQVMYEPMVVFTPVYASVRQQQQLMNQGGTSADGGRPLLSWPDVKEVLSKLEALSIGSADNNNTNQAQVKKEARDEATTGRHHHLHDGNAHHRNHESTSSGSSKLAGPAGAEKNSVYTQ